MAVAYVGAAGANSTVNYLDLSIPAGVAAGDLLVAFVSQQNTGTITPPSGWVEIAHAADAAQDSFAYVKVAATGEPAPTWNRSASGKWTGHVVAYRGAQKVGQATLDSPGSANSWAMPSLAYTGDAPWRVDFLGQRSSTPATDWTVPAGMTKRNQQFTTGSGSTYSVVADSNGEAQSASPIAGLTYSNNGAASSATALISLALGEPVAPAGVSLSVYQGGTELPLTLSVWDGTAEAPVDLTLHV